MRVAVHDVIEMRPNPIQSVREGSFFTRDWLIRQEDGRLVTLELFAATEAALLTQAENVLAARDLAEARKPEKEAVPQHMVMQFEQGYHPIDEPPGFEERWYKQWREAGGKTNAELKPHEWKKDDYATLKQTAIETGKPLVVGAVYQVEKVVLFGAEDWLRIKGYVQLWPVLLFDYCDVPF